MGKAIPFKIVKDDARPLVRQVTDGLRCAVLGGYYAPGDRLPSFNALARELGVSCIVTKEAFKRLVAEGLVASRERLGTFVRDTNEKRWRGRVIFIYDADETGYFQTALAERIRIRLNAEGILFTRSSVDRRDDGTADFSLLDAALARSTDLALVIYGRHDVRMRLKRRGVPFAFIDRLRLPAEAVGVSTLSYDTALRDFAAWCRANDVRDVVQLGWIRHMLDAAPVLDAVGIKCRRRMLAPDSSRGKLIGIEEAAFLEFRRLAEARRISPDTLYFFTDDNLLRGALQALLGTGLKVPGDIRIATVTNAGAGPYIAQSLPRIEVDPVVIGDTIADATLSFLNGGGYRSGEAGGMRWIDGAAAAAPSTSD